MAKMKAQASCVAVLVDIVRSRDGSRTESQKQATTAAHAVNEAVDALDPLRPTVGDEFQGVYSTLGAALRAAHLLRLHMLGSADVRFGLGGGEVRIIDEETGIQDGSAWWGAREAIEAVRTLSDAAGFDAVRTGVREARAGREEAAELESLLQWLDISISDLRGGAQRTLLGLLEGKDVAALAEADGVSASAISQRIVTNRLRALAKALQGTWVLP